MGRKRKTGDGIPRQARDDSRGARYRVLSLLWSPSRSRYYEVGDVVELDDEIAGLLMGKGLIEPAVFERGSGRETLPSKYEVEEIG